MIALIKLGKWENWCGIEGEDLSFRLLRFKLIRHSHASGSGLEDGEKKKAAAIRDGGPNKGGDLLFGWVKCRFVGFVIFLPSIFKVEEK